MGRDSDFVPALGWRRLTPLYDVTVRTLTREHAWRTALVEQIAPRPGERILDVGCGTGSLAILLKQFQPEAEVTGLDPDPDILARAAGKARAAGAEIAWTQGFARDAARAGGKFDKAVSSMVFHQVPMAEKIVGIHAMVEAVGPDGEVHVADFARQTSTLMKVLFGIVGGFDGRANTAPNAGGALERILSSISPAAAVPTASFRTVLGEISLFKLAAAGVAPSP